MRCPACDVDNLPGEDLCANCGLDLAGLDFTAWDLDPDDPLLGMPLEELPLKKPLVLSPDDLVSKAIQTMKDRHEGCVFIEADKRLTGVLTEHDVTTRVAAPGRDPARTRLGEVMTPNPVALQKNDPLSWALHRMGVDGYRHLPVLDGERFVGFLSIRIVLQTLVDA